jgi:hypothetical protein
VSFKGISQTDTIKKIVLNEKVAREVVKDLVNGDFCKQHLLLKNEEIKNLQEQNDELVEIIKIKDSILSKKDEIITVQDKAIGWWKKPELHGYAGVQTTRFTLNQPTLYTNLMLEFPKFSLGAQYFLQPNAQPGYSLIIEYNLF